MTRLLLTAWLCLAAAPGLRAQDGQALLDRLRTKFESVRTLQATFTQRTESTVFGDGAETIRGTIYVEGEKYRLETGLRTLVNDGETLWIYDATEQQVIVSDYVEDAYTFSITGFLYRFDERYRFDSVEPIEEGWRIRMLPKDPDDFFRSVTVDMRRADDLVTRVEVEDANEVTMTFTLDDLVENPPLAADVFRFTAPDGVEVVDLRNG